MGVDIRQNAQYAKYLQETGWKVVKIDNINYFLRRLPLIGYVLKIQRPEKIDPTTIKELLKQYYVSQIIIEPNNSVQENLIQQNYKKSKSCYLPSKTLLLDLFKTQLYLLNSCKKDCKRAIKRNSSIPLKIYDVGDLKKFRNIWKKAVKLKRYVPSLKNLKALKKAFTENSLLITDEKETAGAIFIKTKDIGYYWQAFAGKKGRKNLTQYKIVWEGILWAKKKGAKMFDFEGIHDERYPNKSWLGFTHFKKSFSGKEHTYPGCYSQINLFRIKE